MPAPAAALLLDAAAGHRLGGAARADAELAGEGEHASRRRLDAGGPRQRTVAVVAGELLGEVDDAARVRDEVGCVEDPSGGERVVAGDIGELVVGGADDGPAAQSRDRVAVRR